MPRYKDYLKKMLEDNKTLFENFRKLHDKYSLNPDSLQEKFNKEGEKVVEVIREYENRLCSNQERGMYIRFSGNLAEKFQNEIRKHFPKIDHIGLKVEKKVVTANRNQLNNTSAIFLKFKKKEKNKKNPITFENFVIKKIELL